MLYPNLDVSEMFVDREAQRSSMHTRHLNEQLVRVLKTIGYDVGFQKGQGQYLFDREGARYLDLLSGFGVFAIGRNHPVLRQALKSVLEEIEMVAPTDAAVLICGETGTGKELIARAVHNQSSRRAQPYVKCNLAAIPTGLHQLP